MLTSPAGKGELVAIAGAVAMLIEKSLVAVPPLLSVTVTVNLLSPATRGVPWSVPALKFKPAGNVPCLAQANGPMPSPTARFRL